MKNLEYNYGMPLRIFFICLCSLYFFHPSWYTLLPVENVKYPEWERICIVIKWINQAPLTYYTTHFAAYNWSLSKLSPLFRSLLEQWGFRLPLDLAILLLARLMSAAFALLSVILIYDSALILFDNQVAVFSCFFLIVSPDFAVFCQSGYHHFHAMFLTALAYYCDLKFLTETRERCMDWWIAASGSVVGTLIGSSFYGIFFFPVWGLSLIHKFRDQGVSPKRVVIALASLLAPFLITNSYIFSHPAWYPMNVFYMFYYNIAHNDSGIIYALYQSAFQMFPEAYGAVGTLFLVLGIIGMFCLWRRNGIKKLHLGICLFYMVPALLGGLRSYPARLLLILPFAAISAGFGLCFAYQMMKSSSLRIIAFIFICSLCFYQFVNTWAWVLLKTRPAPAERAVQWIDQENAGNRSAPAVRPFVLLCIPDQWGIPYFYEHLRNIQPLKVFIGPDQVALSMSFDRFVRIPFQEALIDNLDIINGAEDRRSRGFRKMLLNDLSTGKSLYLEHVFKPDISCLGFRFYPPLNDPLLGIIPCDRIFLLRNKIAGQETGLRNAVKRRPHNQQVVLIHTHSDFSANGNYPLETLAGKIKDLGVQAWVPTDIYERKLHLRFGPYEKTEIMTSIEQRGLPEYLRTLRVLRRDQGLNILPGMEVMPHYFWTGNPLLTSLLLHNVSKTMLVIGLQNRNQYDSFRTIKPAFPGDAGELPYQEWIDETHRQGGLIYWSHPLTMETAASVITDFLQFQTLPYGRSLLKTTGYDGFAVLDEGIELARPGGVWDQLLQEHCRGQRNPVYIIGESDYGRNEISDIREEPFVFTILTNKAETGADMLRSLRLGQCYASRRARDGHLIWLDKMFIRRRPDGAKTINLSGYSTRPGATTLFLQIISDGKLIHASSNAGRFQFSQKLPATHARQSYVRVMVEDDLDGMVVSNPLFVREGSAGL
jgi:hypothetical protein